MSRTSRALAISLSLAAGVTATVAGQQTFRTQIDLVHFGVVVTDKQGAPITGLTMEDFEVREDVRTAAIKFLNAIEQAVDITLVDFDTEVRMARYSSSDYARLIERIRGRKTDGWTALYDALGVYLSGTVSQTGHKILVMYTDGGDTRSVLGLGEVLELLRASDVTVYVIGYMEHQPSSTRMAQRMELSRFATTTGGLALFPISVKEVDKMYEKIEREITSRYSLGYTSTDARMDGAWRDVDISLKRPDLKGAKLRTRDGYFAPFKQ